MRRATRSRARAPRSASPPRDSRSRSRRVPVARRRSRACEWSWVKSIAVPRGHDRHATESSARQSHRVGKECRQDRLRAYTVEPDPTRDCHVETTRHSREGSNRCCASHGPVNAQSSDAGAQIRCCAGMQRLVRRSAPISRFISMGDAAHELKGSSRCSPVRHLPQPSCQPRHPPSRETGDPTHSRHHSQRRRSARRLAHRHARRWDTSAYRRTRKRQKYARTSFCRCGASSRQDPSRCSFMRAPMTLKSHAKYHRHRSRHAAPRRSPAAAPLSLRLRAPRDTRGVPDTGHRRPRAAHHAAQPGTHRHRHVLALRLWHRTGGAGRRRARRVPGAEWKHVAADLSRRSLRRLRSQPRTSRAGVGRDHPIGVGRRRSSASRVVESAVSAAGRDRRYGSSFAPALASLANTLCAPSD